MLPHDHMGRIYSCQSDADLVEVMRGSGQGLMQQVASLTVAAQVSRTSQTVGTRFRDQLKDLITRLDQYAALPCPPLPNCLMFVPCPDLRISWQCNLLPCPDSIMQPRASHFLILQSRQYWHIV